MQIDVELDTAGLNCPLPILKTKKALAAMHPGQLIRVVATDPGAVRDFEAYSRQSGHALLESSSAAGRFVFVLRKRDQR